MNILRTHWKRLTWRHVLATIGYMVAGALALGMGMVLVMGLLLVLREPLLSPVCAESPTGVMVMVGLMFTGGTILAAYVPMRFLLSATDWVEAHCGLLPRDS
jgi:hypothetical protein